MSRVVNQEKRRKNSFKVLLSIIVFFLTSAFLIYNIFLLGPIEPILRYSFIGVLIIWNFLKIKNKKKILNKSNKRIKCSIFFNWFLSLIFLILGLLIMFVYSSIDGLSKNTITYSSSLVVLKESSINNISSIKDKNLGMLSDSSYEGEKIPKEILRDEKLTNKVKITTYSDYLQLIDSLYKKEVDGVFLPTNYVNLFSSSSQYSDIDAKTKIIYTKEKTVHKVSLPSKKRKINKPFTVLLTGIDSNVDGLDNASSSNSDTMILVTFNPETLSATMLSIPRDSYVPIACTGGKTKINHSGWYGIECTEETIEDLLDIDIDYYVKINFKGLVGLVDSLGGIDVEVPQDLCTDSSDRTGEVCISKGNQHLNGEEALVLARNRKQLEAGDLDRGLNQQIVVKGILNAVSSNVTNVNALKKILDNLSRNMDTNFDTNQILSFYNIGKDILKKSKKSATDSISITQLYLDGAGVTMYDEGTDLDLYYYALYKDSVETVSNAMKINLGKKKPNMIKKFSFSIDEHYSHIILGKDLGDFTTLYYDESSSPKRKEEKNEDKKENKVEEETKEDKKEEEEKEEDEQDEEEPKEDNKEEKDSEEDPLNTIIP